MGRRGVRRTRAQGRAGSGKRQRGTFRLDPRAALTNFLYNAKEGEGDFEEGGREGVDARGEGSANKDFVTRERGISSVLRQNLGISSQYAKGPRVLFKHLQEGFTNILDKWPQKRSQIY